jgi:carbon storage regulator
MLVLSRKSGESIVIDGDIGVQVVSVNGNVVRLGIDAPQQIPVNRSELYERIRENDRTFPASTQALDQGGKSELHDAVIHHGASVPSGVRSNCSMNANNCVNLSSINACSSSLSCRLLC